MRRLGKLAAGAAAFAGLATAAQDDEAPPPVGWGPGHGAGMFLGRQEAPIYINVWPRLGGWAGLHVRVDGCGGEETVFDAEIPGSGQPGVAAAELARLLDQASRECRIDPAVMQRLAEGFEAAYYPHMAEQAEIERQMEEATPCEGDCNAM